jgi:hypothetical protein
MRRHLVVLLLLAATAPLAAAGPAALPAASRPEATVTQLASYPVFDARGRAAGTAPWLVSDAGGNCCEVYLDATDSGRIVEIGGEKPWYSDDGARTWRSVPGVVPLLLGEGALVPTPEGDVLAVTWDYSQGDRLVAFRQDRRSGEWQTQDVPSRGSQFERPYISVVRGPFVVDGVTHPWMSVVRSIVSTEPDLAYVSTDGLDYRPVHLVLDAQGRPPVTSWLDRTPERSADWTQGHHESEVVSLGRGGLLRPQRFDGYLRTADTSGCTAYVLVPPEPRFTCHRLPAGDLPTGPVVADSRGRLHTVSHEDGVVTVGTSTDGARSWRSTSFAVPGGGEVLDVMLRAHGRVGRTAVQLHVAREDGNGAVLVAVLDTRGTTPRLLRSYQVGRADIETSARGVQGGGLIDGPARWDLPSVAWLPDGRLVAAFLDGAHRNPELAVLQHRA